jgi:hypothetical protein
MALITALPNGIIAQLFGSFAMQSTFTPNPTATLSINFDESTNAALVLDIQTNQSQYTIVLVNSVPTLQKNGVPIAIATPSALYSLQSAILTGVPDATLKATIVALWGGTATAVQQQKALAYALLKLKQSGLI